MAANEGIRKVLGSQLLHLVATGEKEALSKSKCFMRPSVPHEGLFADEGVIEEVTPGAEQFHLQ
ncbi:MAG: hypothetical protein H0X13_08895 [Ramlibacter sp.]|nr:hypothetical protein [Ramlibacter sp.]